MPKKVIIIGGGFAGINAAQALKRADVEITIIDRMNHHVFQPLLYQVATAALSMGDIASPIREILKNQSNTNVVMAQIDRIDKEQRQVHGSHGEIYSYDTLILAPGARHFYFGNDRWEAYAPGLKTIMDALRIRDHMLMAFEKAEKCEDPAEAARYLRFAIIGAGPTGVEMAGSIAEFSHRTLFKNFRYIDPTTSQIYLIEGSNQILPSYPEELAQKAQKDLEDLGVQVWLNKIVTDVTPEGLQIGDLFLPVPNIIWAAGNQASPLLRSLHVPLDKQGRVIVNPDLTIPDDPNIFVLGDAAYCLDKNGKPLPAIAPVAIQQGRYVAKIIRKNYSYDQRPPFLYFDKGTIATIGRGKAVGMIRSFKFSGFFAWLIWCFVHIFYLVSFPRRILVMIQWIFLYIANQRQVRVILRPPHK